MARLLEVFGEFFRAFGYQPEAPAATDSGPMAPALILAKDSRRWGVVPLLDGAPLATAHLEEAARHSLEGGLDGTLILCLGEAPDEVMARAGALGLRVWDARRLCLELGSAVLRETAPDHWTQADPLALSRPSRILDRLHQRAATEPPVPPPAPVEPPAPPVAEPPVADPPLATTPAPETLEIPPAFGIFDQFETVPSPPAPPTPPPSPPPAPAAAARPAAEPTPAASGTPGRQILRMRVDRELAANLARGKTRSVDRLFLRLVPYHVFDYEAQLLVEGSIRAERKTGRMAVHAVRKDIAEWDRDMDVAPLDAGPVDIDERPVKIDAGGAARILREHVRGLMTRDVLMEEDESEWSVVVKKKVELAEDALSLGHLGVHWVPVWRVTGKAGAVEIDASTGQVLHEEIAQETSDSMLL